LLIEPPMFLVLRRDFDLYLLKKALRNNSVVFYKERVSHVARRENDWVLTTNEKSVYVKVLIGADGCRSLVREYVSMPIDPKFIATTVGYIFQCSSKDIMENFEANTVEAYYSHEYVRRGGFIWIFPKRTSINLGIGGMGSGKELRQSLDRFLFSHKAGKRLRTMKGHLYAGLVPEIWNKDFFDTPCAGNNWALIGDAAGHVNPIGGAGIYYAMKGGMLCASAYLQGNIHLFEKYWRQEYGSELYNGARSVLSYYSNYGFLFWFQYYLRNLFHRLPKQI
jgi:digeranylgeranylglycerophospholipid reductase